MSGRSVTITIGTTGSIRTTPSPSSNGVKLAGEESKDKMYEPKHSKKMVRVLTVIAYMFTVSLAAIVLSVYYVLLWSPWHMDKLKMLQSRVHDNSTNVSTYPAILDEIKACCCGSQVSKFTAGDISLVSSFTHVNTSTEIYERPTFISQEVDEEEEEDLSNSVDIRVETEADTGT